MRRIFLGVALAFVLAPQDLTWAKTARECNAEFAANKAAGQAPQSKAEFVTACRAVAAVPGGAGAAGSAKPGSDNGLRKPTAAELAMDRKLKHDMNICIGC